MQQYPVLAALGSKFSIDNSSLCRITTANQEAFACDHIAALRIRLVGSLKPVKISLGRTATCSLDPTQHHSDAAVDMLITPIYHTHSTWIHTEFATLASPLSCQRPPGLSGPSRPPVREALRLGGLAAWRQGLEAPVHTAVHSRAICRLDH